jgi:hypothetical protein
MPAAPACQDIAAAREQGRSERQILDEAVVEAMAEAIFLASNEQAAVHPKMAWADASPGLQAKYRAVALAARDAAIRVRTGEE